MKQQVICQNCGKVFDVFQSRFKWGRGKYCSRDCMYEGRSKKTHEERQCPVCNKIFVTTKKSTKRFCSPVCARRATTLGIIKIKRTATASKQKHVAEWRKRTCLICNSPYIAIKRTQKYCSRKCADIANGQRVSGENNYFYINGNSKNKRCYRGENWGVIRKKIYERDKWTCQVCGKHCNKKEIQCHHIVPYKNGGSNDSSNLVTLCVSCHAIVEQSLDIYNEEFFSFISKP